MEHNTKSIIKQLAMSALALVSVAVLSLSIRHIRFNIHRAKTDESTLNAGTGKVSTSAYSSSTKEKIHSEPSFLGNPEANNYTADSYTAETRQDGYSDYSYIIDIEPDPQNVKASGSEKKAPPESYSEAKSAKDDYARYESSKGSEKISLSDNEDLYRTEKGELWYVSKEADGSTNKMQVKIDNRGDMTIVSGENYAKFGSSQSVHRISVGENEDLYLTGENELWYVRQLPDGSTAKAQLQTENINGEKTIVSAGEVNLYPDDVDKPDEN